MRYDIVRIELNDLTDASHVFVEDDGVAIDFRRSAIPVGFALVPLKAQTHLTGKDIARLADLSSEPHGFQPPAPVAVPSLTVAICTKDHPEWLRRCLRSLDAVRRSAAGLKFEIIVVDNASLSPDLPGIAKEFGAKYFRERIVGLNFARNRALAACSTEILAFVDDDAVVDGGWYSGFCNAYAMAPDAGAFTGQTLPFELETTAQIMVEEIGGFRKGFLPRVFSPTEYNDEKYYPCSTSFGNGCNMAFRTSLMRAIGGFDNALDRGRALPGGGDLDALYRVIRAGRTVSYHPQMLVYHQHRRTTKELRRQLRRSWGAGAMAFFTKIRDTDALYGTRAAALIRVWMWTLFWGAKDSLLYGKGWPLSLQLSVLIGAAQGLTGTYGRSSRAAERLARRSQGARLD